MNHSDFEERLSRKGLRPTANRLLVYGQLAREGVPMSLAGLESALPTLDKSSIFRVLTLFIEHDVAHSFADGRGILNYELCGSQGACEHADGHLHFYCEACQRSFCLENIPLPEIELPEGFTPHTVSFVVKGECPECRRKADAGH